MITESCSAKACRMPVVSEACTHHLVSTLDCAFTEALQLTYKRRQFQIERHRLQNILCLL